MRRNGLNPVQELQSGSPSANMLTGLGIDEYFQRTDASGASSYLTDALGSTLGLANPAGALATSYSYDPFGNTTVSGSSTNPFQFTGRENDGTSLYYYRARYYSPMFQRFLGQDPIGLAGGTNLYRYALDAPTLASDPLGLLTFSIGVTINLQWFVDWSVSVGIVADNCGNIGGYITGGGGAGVGAEGSAGVTFGYSNAPVISDLGGPFGSSEFGGGAGAGGSFGIFQGGSSDGPVTGGDLTIGFAGGAGGSVGLTGTNITPYSNPSPCSCE